MKNLKRPFFSPYVPWRFLGIFFLIDLVIAFMTITRSTSPIAFAHPEPGLYIAMGMSIAGPLVSGVLCMQGSFGNLRHPASSEGGRQTRRFSPLLWGLSGFAYATGQSIWISQSLITKQVPTYPGIAHFIGFIPYICLIAAILLLPERSISLLPRLRILLDSLMIMAAVTTLCYYFVLAPLLAQGHGTQLAKLIGGLYPVLDLLAMLCVLMVALRSGERVLYPVLIFLGLATMIQFVVNTLHLYEVLYNNYNEFSVASIAMVAYGTLLIGAAQTVSAILRKGERVEPVEAEQDDVACTDALWKIVCPVVLVLIFGLLVFMIWLDGGQTFPGQISIVYIGGAVVLILMVLRLVLTTYQIGLLQKNLQAKNSSLDVLNMQLEKQATTDPLTDLPNHRALVEKLDEALGQARQNLGSCSVIFMDLDHFKATNDYYGHLVGDAVLNSFARIVTSTVRACDLVGRWGGEEFVAILPDTGSAEAFQIAEQIRVVVNQRVSGCASMPGLTCSSGVATYPQDASTRENLLRHADRAMYVAKRRGRNQTCIAHEPLVLPNKTSVRVPGCREEARVSGIAEAMLALVEARDPSLSRHARRVAALALKLARELGLSEAEGHIISLGGLLHDLGNIAMPDEFLYKHVCTDEEVFEQRARYQVIGAELLAPVRALKMIAAIVREHCECVDGSGYPNRLKGEEILLGARIVAVASAYDTALGERFTRPARASAAALKELRRASGSRFDPRVIGALTRVLAGSPRLARVDVA
ncbi:MAG TPA: diguanylate cyclase [Ktedonobacteraceae bacterium]|nr:diguanylate cyclase [Ktedonobacteraceae bacterium]